MRVPESRLIRDVLRLDGELFFPAPLGLHEGRIANILSATSETSGGGAYAIPGLVDVHVHGYGGFEPATGGHDALLGMAHALACAGTTAFLPTLYPDTPDVLLEQVGEIARAMATQRERGFEGARIEGAHLEGPFVNPTRCGALDVSKLRLPDRTELERLVSTWPGVVRRITLAPELPGAEDLARCAGDHGIRVSMGHSDASCKLGKGAGSWGASGVTHLFNAMRGIHHREPGLAFLPLIDGAFDAELIADGRHVHPEVLRFVIDSRGGPDGLLIISDALWAAGTSIGSFRAGGRTLHHGEDAMWTEDSSLAGAARSQLEMVRDRVGEGTFTWREALELAATQPARTLGVEHALREGERADFVLLDAGLEVASTWVAGRPVFEAASPA